MYYEKKFSKIRKKSKYHNVSQVYNGIRYHSKGEAKYAQELDWLVKAGEVIRWERQVKIDIRVNGKHICNYYIDFKVYYPDDTIKYVEYKGMETEVWRLKWKLVEALKDELLEPEAELEVVKHA